MTTTQRIGRFGMYLLAVLSVISIVTAVISTQSAYAAAPPQHHAALQGSEGVGTPRETYTQRLHRLAADVRAHGAPCAVEDGSVGPLPCYWDAHSAGNEMGTSFVILNGGIRGAYQNVIFVYSDHIVREGWAL